MNAIPQRLQPALSAETLKNDMALIAQHMLITSQAY